MRERQAGEVLVLSFESAFPADPPELEQALQVVNSALSRGHARIVVNLDEVEVVKALTLGLLVTAAKQCAEREGRLVVCCANRRILHIFKLAGLDRILSIRNSEEDAIAYFAELGRS